MASALSDLAAMGADPGEAYLALGLPAGFGEQRALELVRAAAALACETRRGDRRWRRRRGTGADGVGDGRGLGGEAAELVGRDGAAPAIWSG